MGFDTVGGREQRQPNARDEVHLCGSGGVPDPRPSVSRQGEGGDPLP